MSDILIYNLTEFINDIWCCVHGNFKYPMCIIPLQLHYILFMLANYSLFLTTKLILAICSSNDCLFCDRIIWKEDEYLQCLCLLLAVLCVVTHCCHEDVCHEVNNTNLNGGRENLLIHNCDKKSSNYADFVFRFYKQAISKEADKNIFFSPMSISTAFAMLAVDGEPPIFPGQPPCHRFLKAWALMIWLRLAYIIYMKVFIEF